MRSGTAVRASAKLCKVSPSRATERESRTTASWIRAVTSSPARLMIRARRPALSASNASSIWSAVSWEWPPSISDSQ